MFRLSLLAQGGTSGASASLAKALPTAGSLARYGWQYSAMPADAHDELPLVRNQDLYQYVRSAFHALHRIVESHIAAGRFMPQRPRPTLSEFSGGWPNISSPSPFSDGPPEPSKIFGIQAGGSAGGVKYMDVPELVRLVKYVRDNSDLRDRLCAFQQRLPRSGEAESEVASRIEEYEISRWPLEILDRAYAIGSFDDVTFLGLYQQLETALLDLSLSYDLLVPLLLTSFEIDEPYRLDDDISLEPLSHDLQLARVTQANSVRGVPEPLISAATHALVVHNQELDNTSTASRFWNPGAAAQVSLTAVDLACQAIAICVGKEVGYAQVLVRPNGWADGWKHDLPVLEEVLVLRRYPDSFDNYGWLSDRQQIRVADFSNLSQIYRNLRSSSAETKLAARRLLLARTRPDEEDKVVDACIGLEALLGEGRDELSHRMALRAATVFGARERRAMNARVAYQVVKRVYDHRSAIVHGTTNRKKAVVTIGDDKYQAVDLAILLLRELLHDQLAGPTGGWTPQDLDNRLLDALNVSHELGG